MQVAWCHIRHRASSRNLCTHLHNILVIGIPSGMNSDQVRGLISPGNIKAKRYEENHLEQIWASELTGTFSSAKQGVRINNRVPRENRGKRRKQARGGGGRNWKLELTEACLTVRSPLWLWASGRGRGEGEGEGGMLCGTWLSIEPPSLLTPCLNLLAMQGKAIVGKGIFETCIRIPEATEHGFVSAALEFPSHVQLPRDTKFGTSKSLQFAVQWQWKGKGS